MSWKKNAFSYITWFLYVLIAEALLLTCAGELGRKSGLSVYMCVLIAFLYVALVGVGVLLIRFAISKGALAGEKRKLFGLIAEAVICVGLLTVGLMLRITNIDSMTQSAAYFETAQVTYGQSIPPVVHGAVYLYLQVLHGLFLIVGNHFVAGIWLQIVLQMMAFLLLYSVVRRISGAVAALITLSFGMCAPFFVQHALTLSPQMLYFFLMVLVAAIYMMGYGKKLRPAIFVFFGALAAVMTYLDMTGLFLFLFAMVIVFMKREADSSIGRKWLTFGCAFLSFAGVFTGGILLDALLSNRDFFNVLKAWGNLYSRKPYVSSGLLFPTEEIVLIGLLVVGIFGFWCHKQEEIISVCVLNIVVLFCVYLNFTQEIPGDLYYMVMFMVMAGAFVGQIFASDKSMVAVAEHVPDELSESKEICEVTEMDSNAQIEVQQVEEVVEQELPKVKFIENPLPLPKKHERRVFEYAVELTDETADFDIAVSDEDDYEI